MDDLISRASFRSNIQTVLNDTTCPINIAAEIEQYLELESAVDAVPVVYARWKDYKDEHQCSACKEIVCVDSHTWRDIQFDFCPYCGAKMIGDDNG